MCVIDYNSFTKELYDLSTDPYENTNLLQSTLSPAQTTAKLALEAEISRIRQ